MLPDKVISIYWFLDDLLKTLEYQTKEGCRITDAENLTTALVNSLVFKGNQCVSINYMRSHNMALLLPGKSCFTNGCFSCKLAMWLSSGTSPVATAWTLLRFRSARTFVFRVLSCSKAKRAGGYASIQQYFFRIKIQVITTEVGFPIEVCFVPGAEHDAEAIR